MSIPISTVPLARAFNQSLGMGQQMRARVQQLRTASSLGPTERALYLTLQRELSEAMTLWASAAAMPGLVAYARAELGDGTLDLVAELIAARSAAQTLRDWIFTNFPREAGSGAVLTHTYSQEGVATPLTFSVAATAGFRAAADAFIAALA